jgi:hypothetical protein
VLALALGVPVLELQTRITSAEFQEWRAYYQEEPFGDLRDDFRGGVLASIVQNLFIGRGDAAASPADFITHADGKAATTGPAARTDPDLEERKSSQAAMISKMKSTLTKG